MKQRHKGPYLATVIENLLKEYGISLLQIYTGTADQAKNMTNTVRQLNNLADRNHNNLNMENENPVELFDEYNSEELDTSDDESLIGFENRIELDNELNNPDRYVELVNSMTTELHRRANFLSPIQKVHCCAHTVQLAVNEAINQSTVKEVIINVREMIVQLRTQVINIKFRQLAPDCILPPLHIEIRWNSDYCYCVNNCIIVFIEFSL